MKRILTYTSKGIGAGQTVVKCSMEPGIGIHLVGLHSDIAVKECLLRTVTALQSLGYHIPGHKIVINIAPVSDGPSLDVPVALAMLIESGQVKLTDSNLSFAAFGELGLDGTIRGMRTSISKIQQAMIDGVKNVIVPEDNIDAIRQIWKSDEIIPVKNLKDVIAFLETGRKPMENIRQKEETPEYPDFANLVARESIKRGFEIAAAGGHHILLAGEDGCGKSTLAKYLPGILPEPTSGRAMEMAKIASCYADRFPYRFRPFRTIDKAMNLTTVIGGGPYSAPGEIVKAHGGVVLARETASLPNSIKECLPDVIQNKCITISRLHDRVTYPANVQFVAETSGKTVPEERIFDITDVQIHCDKFIREDASGNAESSEKVRERVTAARKIQSLRFRDENINLNAEMNKEQCDRYCNLSQNAQKLLEQDTRVFSLSQSEQCKILKIARTIADLDNADTIEVFHLAEAVAYRYLKVQRD